MTFYSSQVHAINNRLYKEYITTQIITAKQYIDKCFDEKINLDEVAGKAFISKFHFTRLFKSYYGITPHQYLIDVRISKAKQLLKCGMTVSEISAAIGFSSSTSFTALFKKMTGATPSGFKQSSFLK